MNDDRPGIKFHVSRDGRRMYDASPVFGIALYRITPRYIRDFPQLGDDRFEATHVALVESPEEAEAWLDGKQLSEIKHTVVYPDVEIPDD